MGQLREERRGELVGLQPARDGDDGVVGVAYGGHATALAEMLQLFVKEDRGAAGASSVAGHEEAKVAVVEECAHRNPRGLVELGPRQGSVIEAKVVGHMAKPRHVTYVRQ